MARQPQELERLRVVRDWSGPSPKRYNGWTPTYVTEYEYDDTGRLIRSTTRQTEPEWDDDDRGLAEGLGRYENDVCPGCNIHPTVINDLGTLTFEDRLCKVCRGQAGYTRVLAERDHDWDEKNPKAGPTTPRPSDGLYTLMRLATPEEMAQRKRR